MTRRSADIPHKSGRDRRSPPISGGRTARAGKAFGAAVAPARLVLACSSDEAGSADEPDAGPRDWVVVSYDVPKDYPALMVLLDTEREVDRALHRSGAGVINGNEVGQGRYDLYLVGADREELWDLVEPILADAAVQLDPRRAPRRAERQGPRDHPRLSVRTVNRGCSAAGPSPSLRVRARTGRRALHAVRRVLTAAAQASSPPARAKELLTQPGPSPRRGGKRASSER